jgi:hypothetical protein
MSMVLSPQRLSNVNPTLGWTWVLLPQCLNNVKPYLGWACFYHRNVWIMWTLLGMSMVLSPQHLSNMNLLGLSMVLSPQHLSNVNPTLGWTWVLLPQCFNNVKPYLGWAWFYHRNVRIMWTLLGMSMDLSPQHLSNMNLLGLSMVLSPQHLSNVNPTWDVHGSIAAMFE